MDAVYVTGHRNPDMDSVCSAWAYARLKNRTGGGSSYRAVRCGHLNNQTRETFRQLGVEPPVLLKDVHPRAGDIVAPAVSRLAHDEPVLNAIRLLHDYTVSILPVFRSGDPGTPLAGLVSVQEISDFLMSEQVGARPRYTFRVENFGKVLPGVLHRRGENGLFRAPIMVGAMPYEVSVERINMLLPDKPVLVVGERESIIRYAVEKQFPAIILTGVARPEEIRVDLEGYPGTVFLSSTDTAETVRLLRLSAPVEDIMGTDYPRITDETHFDDAKKMLLQSEYRGLPVFSSEDGSAFLGLVTRRSFIDRPRRRLIMVDHNEAAQSIRGIENAEVIEIIDHHRLAPEKTRTPIYVASKPVGSTCTIVFQHYLSAGEPVDATTAGVLLAGILSDTVLLKSPTTTPEDRTAVQALADLAGVDYRTFGEEMFSRTAVLSEKEPGEVVEADFKVYREYGFTVGIGQVEVVTLEDLGENSGALKNALERTAEERNLDWALLLVTNVLKENSKLISMGPSQLEEKLIYRNEGEGVFDLPGILSRKKQLLPEVLRVLEEAAEN